MNNTISLFNGAITINKAKLDARLSAVSCAGLYFVRILLMIGAVLFFTASVIAAGNDRVCDGNPTMMFIMMGFSVFCGLCARFTSMLMEMIEHEYAIRSIRRKHARMRAHAKS